MRDRLYRSREERVLFGVAGGIAEWLDIDPAVVRIVFALLVLTLGAGILLYIVMALVIPEEPVGMAGGGMAAPAAPWAGTGPAAAGPAPGGPAAPSGTAWVDTRAERRAARRAARGDRDGRGVVIFGAILIIVGTWFLLRRYIPALDGDVLGPVILIGIGALLLFGAMNRGGPSSPPGQG
jgi:phage shock protein C